MNIFYIISAILIFAGIILLIITIILDKDKKKKNKKLKPNEKTNYAILIPARNESAVIENLLISIKKQSSLDSTYIIIEDEKDPTVKIAKKYHANIFVRTNLNNRRRKGFALDECLKEILKTKNYDLYFIFDADNILDDNFIKEMLETYKKGYDICTGYRNIKNDINSITTCSGLTFSMINGIFNQFKIKNNKSIIISGTGYYISGNLINKWQGFPFNSLTEDYELSLYCANHYINTYYNEKAIFYDEQPTLLKVSKKQRLRWIKGFLDSRKLYIKNIKKDYTKIIGITPYLLVIFGVIVFLITLFIELLLKIISGSLLIKKYLFLFLIFPLIIYIVLFIFTFIIVINEDNKLNLSFKHKVVALFYNPLFLVQYIPLFFKSLFVKEVKWDAIKHNSNKKP